MDAGPIVAVPEAGAHAADAAAPRSPLSDARVTVTVTGFIGRALRGPVDRAVRVRGFDEFQRVFGGHCADSHLSRAVAQYFANGGAEAVVVRVANRARCCTLTLPAGESALRLRARDPGTHEWLRASVDHDGLDDDPARFNLVVQRLSDAPPRRVVDQEIHRSVSVHPGSDRYVGDVLAASELVRLGAAPPPGRPAATLHAGANPIVGYVNAAVDGDGGREITDYDVIGSAREVTGLFALGGERDLSLLCIPPLSPGRDAGLTTLVAAERFCRSRGAMLVFDPPLAWRTVQDALREAPRLGFASANAATYFPRPVQRGSGGGDPLPACGAIAGVLARKDATAGVWKPLDSMSGALRGDLGVSEDVEPAVRARLNRLGINVLARGGAGHCIVRGDVTFAAASASAPAWRSLTRRRLALHVLAEVGRCTRWTLFETCDAVTWARVRHQLGRFLQRLHERGAFAGLSPAQSWFVKCDADTAVPGREGGLRTTVVIGLALSRPGEFLIFSVVQAADGWVIRPLPLTRELSLAHQQPAGDGTGMFSRHSGTQVPE